MANSEGNAQNYKKAYGNRSPGLFYLMKKKEILVYHAMSGNFGKDFLIPAEDLLAADKTTTFKISQEMDDGKLMFKVNFLLYSALCDNQIVVIILVLFSKAEKGLFCWQALINCAIVWAPKNWEPLKFKDEIQKTKLLS